MSLYGTIWTVDATDHDLDCARWVRCVCATPAGHARAAFADDAHWRFTHDLPCTCTAGPIRYDGSHILPMATSYRYGSASLAHIAGFIDPPGVNNADDTHAHEVWPYIRLCVNDATVVLDDRQVLALYHALGDWLACEKRTP